MDRVAAAGAWGRISPTALRLGRVRHIAQATWLLPDRFSLPDEHLQRLEGNDAVDAEAIDRLDPQPPLFPRRHLLCREKTHGDVTHVTPSRRPASSIGR